VLADLPRRLGHDLQATVEVVALQEEMFSATLAAARRSCRARSRSCASICATTGRSIPGTSMTVE
jgi:hypothetical protein